MDSDEEYREDSVGKHIEDFENFVKDFVDSDDYPEKSPAESVVLEENGKDNSTESRHSQPETPNSELLESTDKALTSNSDEELQESVHDGDSANQSPSDFDFDAAVKKNMEESCKTTEVENSSVKEIKTEPNEASNPSSPVRDTLGDEQRTSVKEEVPSSSSTDQVWVRLKELQVENRELNAKLTEAQSIIHEDKLLRMALDNANSKLAESHNDQQKIAELCNLLQQSRVKLKEAENKNYNLKIELEAMTTIRDKLRNEHESHAEVLRNKVAVLERQVADHEAASSDFVDEKLKMETHIQQLQLQLQEEEDAAAVEKEKSATALKKLQESYELQLEDLHHELEELQERVLYTEHQKDMMSSLQKSTLDDKSAIQKQLTEARQALVTKNDEIQDVKKTCKEKMQQVYDEMEEAVAECAKLIEEADVARLQMKREVSRLQSELAEASLSTAANEEKKMRERERREGETLQDAEIHKLRELVRALTVEKQTLDTKLKETEEALQQSEIELVQKEEEVVRCYADMRVIRDNAHGFNKDSSSSNINTTYGYTTQRRPLPLSPHS
eukprot:GCRY01003938.1.p1 GENE.GCRY01003938.1~~GCRY01003938.1.p1  ORF type:complete len:559 (-),score=107.93 GCRY01003938.1:96-1772(-)